MFVKVFVFSDISVYSVLRFSDVKIFFLFLSVNVYLFGMCVAFDSNMFLTLICLGFVFDFSYIKL